RDCELQCVDEKASIVRAGHGFVQKPFSMFCLKDTSLWDDIDQPLEQRYDCPSGQCSVSGIIPKLVEHLIDYHHFYIEDTCTFSHRFILSNPLEMKNRTLVITVIHCYERHFCLQLEGFHPGRAPFYMLFVRFMGDDTEAKKFKYCFRVSGAGRELTWDGVPRSIGEGHKKVLDDLNGLVIPVKLALFIASGNEQELRLIRWKMAISCQTFGSLRVGLAGKVGSEERESRPCVATLFFFSVIEETESTGVVTLSMLVTCDEAVRNSALVLLIGANSCALAIVSSLLISLSLAVDAASCSLCKVLVATSFVTFLAMKATDSSIDGGIVRWNESTIDRRSV
ncbi:E3 ubiquitin protein ligase SINAT2, partial [Tanacetum coccineum]